MRTGMIGASAVLIGLALTAATTTPAPGQEPATKGTGERIGRGFDRILREVRSEFKDLSADVQQRFAHTRSDVLAMGVEARVYGRLHWDKALNGARIAVAVAEDGSATLSGTVPSAEARARAVALSSETVGVNRVVDQLKIDPAAAPDPGTEAP